MTVRWRRGDRRRHLATGLVAGAIVLGSVGVTGAAALNAAAPPDTPTSGMFELPADTIATLRAAVADLAEPETALATGRSDLVCVDGTGHYFANPVKLADGVLDPLDPEALIYADVDGGRRIVAVAWMSTAPGQVQGVPMHLDDGLELWVLHAWVALDNPAGMLADRNPTIGACASAVPTAPGEPGGPTPAEPAPTPSGPAPSPSEPTPTPSEPAPTPSGPAPTPTATEPADPAGAAGEVTVLTTPVRVRLFPQGCFDALPQRHIEGHAAVAIDTHGHSEFIATGGPIEGAFNEETLEFEDHIPIPDANTPVEIVGSINTIGSAESGVTVVLSVHLSISGGFDIDIEETFTESTLYTSPEFTGQGGCKTTVDIAVSINPRAPSGFAAARPQTPPGSPDPAGAGVYSFPDEAIETLRDGLSQFAEPTAAIDSGRVFRGVCVDGAGLYFADSAAIVDGALDPTNPEAIIYADVDDAPRPVAVAWLATAPGQVLGVPMHLSPDLDLWILHAWVGLDNPNGMLADHHPDLPDCAPPAAPTATSAPPIDSDTPTDPPTPSAPTTTPPTTATTSTTTTTSTTSTTSTTTAPSTTTTRPDDTSPFTVSTTNLYFGVVPVGRTNGKSVSVTNNTDSSLQVSITHAQLEPEFSFESNCAGLLAPGVACNVGYTFAPTSEGGYLENTSFRIAAGQASQTFSITLHGEATAPSGREDAPVDPGAGATGSGDSAASPATTQQG